MLTIISLCSWVATLSPQLQRTLENSRKINSVTLLCSAGHEEIWPDSSCPSRRGGSDLLEGAIRSHGRPYKEHLHGELSQGLSHPVFQISRSQ